MNVDREAKDYTDADVADVRQQLNEHQKAESLSWAEISRLIGSGPSGQVANSTLSAFANGTYAGGDPEKARNVAWKVNRYLQAVEARRNEALQMPDVPGYVATRTSRAMMAQVKFAHMGNIAVMIGAAGMGKTETFKRYCAVTNNAFHLEMNQTTRTPGAILHAIAKVTGRPIKSRGMTTTVLFEDIVNRLKNSVALLIIDEAQHARDDTLDLLRQIHDAAGCGLVLAGNRTVLGRVQAGAREAEFAALHSRVSWPQAYEVPYPDDVEMLCDAWGVPKDTKQREFLQGVGKLPGALRSVTQTLLMATIDARLDDEDRTLSHLKAAWTQQRQLVAA